MAVRSKQSEPRRYQAEDFTTEQRQRFANVANAALKRRELYRKALEKSLAGNMKDHAFKPVVPPHPENPHRIRQVIWLVTFLLVGLWVMYMFA